MNFEAGLFTADKFEKSDQGRVGGNGLPFAHDALRVNNFACEHGAAVHGKLQNVNHFFAAVHFHVRAGGHKESTALRLLRRSVIEQAPKRTNGPVALDGAVVDINNAGIGGGHFLPFCVSSQRRCQHQQHSGKRNSPMYGQWYKHCAKESALSGPKFHSVFNNVHARYYKVVPTS